MNPVEASSLVGNYDWEAYLKEFSEYLEQSGLALKTIPSYRSVIRELVRRPGIVDPSTITSRELDDFLLVFRVDRPTAFPRAKSAIKRFVNWTTEERTMKLDQLSGYVPFGARPPEASNYLDEEISLDFLRCLLTHEFGEPETISPGQYCWQIDTSDALQLATFLPRYQRQTGKAFPYFYWDAQSPIYNLQPLVATHPTIASMDETDNRYWTPSPLAGDAIAKYLRVDEEFFGSPTKNLILVQGTTANLEGYIKKAQSRFGNAGSPIVLAVDTSWTYHRRNGAAVKRAYISEEFLTWLIAHHLKNLGFFVDKFGGALLRADLYPDLFAIKSESLVANLSRYTRSGLGSNPIDLETPFSDQGSVEKFSGCSSALLIEVESSRLRASEGLTQLKNDYLPVQGFNFGALVVPFLDIERYWREEGIAVFTISPAGEIVENLDSLDRHPADISEQQMKDLETTHREVETIAKLALLKRIPWHHWIGSLAGDVFNIQEIHAAALDMGWDDVHQLLNQWSR